MILAGPQIFGWVISKMKIFLSLPNLRDFISCAKRSIFTFIIITNRALMILTTVNIDANPTSTFTTN